MKRIIVILGMLINFTMYAQQVTINSPGSICAGQSATLIAQVPGLGTDTLTFQWLIGGQSFGAPNNDSILVNPNGSANYSVIVSTNQNTFVFSTFAQSLGTTTLTVNPLPNATANGGSFCQGSTINLSASGGISYSWTGPNNFTSNTQNPTLSAVGSASGTYHVAVVNSAGCSTVVSTQVTVHQNPVLNVDSIPVSCNGLSDGIAFVSSITGGTAPFSYFWNTNSTSNAITGLASNVYSVIVTDANGCSASGSTIVTQPAPLTLSAQVTNVSCNNGNNGSIDLTVNGGTAPYSYQWSNGFTGQDPQGLLATSFSVTVTDANSCSTSGNWTVNQPANLTITTSTTIATCVANGSANVSVSGGTAPYSYQWSNGASTSSINAPAGMYTVIVTDANGCQISGATTIGTPVPVTATGSANSLSCFGSNNGSINLTVNGSSPFSYAWTNGATTQNLTGLSAGSYSVTVTASNGCTTTQSFVINQPSILGATTSTTHALCYNGTGIVTAIASGGTMPYTYTWSNGATTMSASALAGVHTVTVTDANGCIAQASTIVTQPSQLLSLISSQTNIACAGNNNGSATVSVIGGTAPYSLLWSNGAQTQTAFGLSAGNYTVTVTDANGCSTTNTATITTAGSALYGSMTSNPSCGNSNNGSITTSVSGGQQPYSYQWSNGANSPSISGLAPGNYSVTITDANGCQWQGSQQITGSPGIIINLNNQVLCENNNNLINASFTGGTWPYQFIWTTPSGQIFTTYNINPIEQGVYQLTIIDAFGCQASGSMFITLIPCDPLSVDNIFSNENITLFPNPISLGGIATIQFPYHNNDVAVQLMDISGKILSEDKVLDENYKLHTSGLSSGTYIVRIVSHNQIVTKRLIVQ